MKRTTAMIAVTAFCLTCTGAAGGQTPDETEAGFIAWLKEHGVPLATVEPGHDMSDMRPLAKMIGDARIVSMGEPTHGAREVFQFKHRMFEFLVAEMGFTVFGLEASYPACVAINNYVLHGEGDPAVALNGQGFWTWDTEEVLDLILWMRSYNEDPTHERKLKFYGFDMQVFKPAVDVALPYLEQVDADRAAALRDGLEPMMDVRSPRQVQDWPSERWVSLSAAAAELVKAIDAHRDALVEASSAAEFTHARQHAVVVGQFVEMMYAMAEPVPGFPTAELQRLSGSIQATAASLAAYLEEHDADFSASVADRLTQIREEGMPLAMAYAEEMDDEQRAEWDALGAAILARLTRSEADLIAQSSSEALDEARAWAADVQSMVRAMRGYADFGGELRNVRDRCMAENVAWILRQEGPDARIMLWAHNLHVYRPTESPRMGTMGSELHRMFGDDHVVFGFSFNAGSFQAIYYDPGGEDDGKPRLREHTIDPAPEGFVAHALARAEAPLLVVDLRTAQEGSAAHDWLGQTHRMRSIGAVYSDDIAANLAHNLVLRGAYDVLIFIGRITRARPSELIRERFGMPDPSE